MTGFYGVQGNPISDAVGEALMADIESRRFSHEVVDTDAGPVEVSTMFIPRDMRSAEDIEQGRPPLIFETAALLDDNEIAMERRSTGAEAAQAHFDVLSRVQSGRL
ncbi:hypothetical protein Franean1_5012 [Parafrankia sp. EAN1pec]|uniref:hypothetical protein n=1 Tax=Parafrankia sp. (strain EAN1pec) TaxID=298653 RepID=UPI0000544A1F|nr:hypothetical protein Franean1_5012 [Frankia sp. EAN1pec]